MFRKFIKDLNTLQIEGITLNLEDRSEKVYFCVGLLLADNLGFQNAMGFAGGFNSNYYCRFRKVCKEVMRLQFKEKRGDLRKVRDYCEDVALGLKLSGVVENSVWNSLLSFHVYENYAADILHDLFEGVCKTDMIIILQYYICEKRSFSVASLNARINSFNYNLNGLGNKPPSFTYEDIQDGKLNMSATEMFNFTLLFSFFVGDMFEPDRQDPVLLLYLTLREII